jgi:hypothetical protein
MAWCSPCLGDEWDGRLRCKYFCDGASTANYDRAWRRLFALHDGSDDFAIPSDLDMTEPGLLAAADPGS